MGNVLENQVELNVMNFWWVYIVLYLSSVLYHLGAKVEEANYKDEWRL